MAPDPGHLAGAVIFGLSLFFLDTRHYMYEFGIGNVDFTLARRCRSESWDDTIQCIL